MHRYILLLVVLGLIPWILGRPWLKQFNTEHSNCFAYGVGFFIELALFEIIAFPFIISYSSFHIVVVLFSISLVGCSIFCIWFIQKNNLLPKLKNRIRLNQFAWHEWTLLILFLVMVSVQIVRGFTRDITYMSYDDATYTTVATDALDADQVGTVYYYTGQAESLITKIASQTSLCFPAYLSAVSGISVATMEHTIQYIQLILLAYIIYTYMAGELFFKRMDQIAFLLIISVFYIFGYHSHYSLTFRLLGPNYQGKAVLAVSLTPLVLTILIQKTKEPYQWQTGMLLLLLSLAAVSLTLWGTGTMMVIVLLPVLLSLCRRERNWKHLLYILWGCTAPVGFIGLYYMYRLAL